MSEIGVVILNEVKDPFAKPDKSKNILNKITRLNDFQDRKATE